MEAAFYKGAVDHRGYFGRNVPDWEDRLRRVGA